MIAPGNARRRRRQRDRKALAVARHERAIAFDDGPIDIGVVGIEEVERRYLIAIRARVPADDRVGHGAPLLARRRHRVRGDVAARGSDRGDGVEPGRNDAIPVGAFALGQPVISEAALPHLLSFDDGEAEIGRDRSPRVDIAPNAARRSRGRTARRRSRCRSRRDRRCGRALRCKSRTGRARSESGSPQARPRRRRSRRCHSYSWPTQVARRRRRDNIRRCLRAG